MSLNKNFKQENYVSKDFLKCVTWISQYFSKGILHFITWNHFFNTNTWFPPLPVVFWKMFLLKRGWNLGFLWLLMLSYRTSFLIILLKYLKSFRGYKEFLCQYELFSSIYDDFLDFLTFPCYKETNDLSL